MGGSGLNFGNLPVLQLHWSLATKDGDQHANNATLGQHFIDGAFITGKWTLVDGDVVSLFEFEFDLGFAVGDP